MLHNSWHSGVGTYIHIFWSLQLEGSYLGDLLNQRYLYIYTYRLCKTHIYRHTWHIFTLLRKSENFLLWRKNEKGTSHVEEAKNHDIWNGCWIAQYLKITSGFQRIRVILKIMIPGVLKLHHGSIMSEICPSNGWAGVSGGACPILFKCSSPSWGIPWWSSG